MENKDQNKDKKALYHLASQESYTMPKTVEHRNKKWISWGEDNTYFQDLIQRYLGSPTNARCINGISDMIYGRGLEATDRKWNQDQYLEMKKLISGKELRKIVVDRKKLGQAAVKVSYNKSKTKVIAISHFPMETLRAEKADSKGVIKAYYYHPKWSDVKPSDEPKRIPTFGNGSKSQRVEIYIIKPYRSGFYYYSPPDYHSCIQYCTLEEEVSNYHINKIRNGLQPSMMINFNNGVPDKESRELIEQRINDKFGGSSNAGSTIISWNEDRDTAADITPIHLPDAHAQYQFFADEAREKIMLGHGIVSPILLGIKDNTGFGNNAEELRTASVIMDNIVIRPFQDDIIAGLDQILAVNKIYLDLYFVTLQPIEFVEMDNIETSVVRERETGEKLSAEDVDLSDDEGNDILEQLEGLGETISDEWELVHSEPLKDAEKPFNLSEANPGLNSKEDDAVYKVRYAYMPVTKNPKSRDFCKKMEGFTERGVVFRKEDINMMSFRGVNRELGHKKQNYSLLKFKGGKNCHHFWEVRVYKLRVRDNNEVDKKEAVNDGLDYPNNPSEMPVRPIDMPNRGGFLNKIRQKWM